MFVDFDKVFKRDKNGKLITSPSADFTVSTANVDLHWLETLMGKPEKRNVTMFFVCTEPIYDYVPARRHKKKRIQKKWIKRFGYVQKKVGERQVERTIEDLQFRQSGDEFVLVKECKNE